MRGESGSLAVAFVGSAAYGYLGSTLAAYRARDPDVELRPHELSTAALRGLHAERIEADFVRPPIKEVGLEIMTVLTEPLMAVPPVDHALAGEEAVPLATLADEPWVLFPRELGAGLHDTMLRRCERASCRLVVVQEAVQLTTLVALVAADFGESVLPASVGQLHLEGAVARPLAPGDGADMGLATAWRQGDRSVCLAALRALVSGRS